MTSFWPVRLAQPDRRTCGPSVLVSLRMLESAGYRERVLRGGPEAARARFAAEVWAAHRTTNRAARLARPAPAALGARPRHRARGRWPGTSAGRAPLRRCCARRRAAAYDRLVASLRAGPTPVYVGNRWTPRHVVLAVAVRDGVVTCYEPASGRRTRFTRDEWLARPPRGLRRLAGAVGRRGAAPRQPSSPARAAYSGLMTRSMRSSRSSKGRNADFIALMVNQRRSSRP